MLKQIYVKSLHTSGSLVKMYEEAKTYLQNIGFLKIPLMAVTDIEHTFRSYLFSQGFEKVMLEYNKDMHEEVLKLVFTPAEIRFVYDILLMRFNQIARDEEGNVFIYNE
jgi:hypothetical protein